MMGPTSSLPPSSYGSVQIGGLQPVNHSELGVTTIDIVSALLSRSSDLDNSTDGSRKR